MAGDTHDCDNCGDHGHNPNPLDACGGRELGCHNPCGAGHHNTPHCESLPSQIQNFTDQFFGTVVKTVVNGEIKWSLPCGLDVGLPGNPRGVGEGLACYFLRLFSDGIGGLKGDKGNAGDDGAAGNNAYAVLRQGFTQPTIASPLAQFVIFANPAIVAGLYVFVQNSGYYLVTDVQPGGVIFATMISVAAPALAYVPIGSLVIPAGPPAP